MNSRKTQMDFSDPVTRTMAHPCLTPFPRRGAQEVIEVDFNRNCAPSTDAAPASMSNDQLVEALAASITFREYRRAFEEATGMPLALRAVGGWQLAHGGNRRQNAFCALMSRTSRSCAACLRAQQRVCDGVNGVPCTLNCPFGITETAVGVKIGREIIAYLQTGQVLFKPPTPRQTGRAIQQLREWAPDVDLNEAGRRYNETPVVRRNEYEAVVRLLQFFADQLGALANQIVLQQKDVEPAQITRARQFIETHYQEDLSLTAVAREAGMSQFYFCKTFKKATGLKFSHYVCRVRVEKAKNLLLNPNYRISEIAYEVGFQSLTHFNRVFKTIAGCSPTEFRRQLPGASRP
ncbi:MAG: helix-turn-helix domain-containing protein [Verrucomicrobiota bacterium]|nr:helix-turn-helix domain-containing protein [Verrucomicrobiota bacterium]